MGAPRHSAPGRDPGTTNRRTFLGGVGVGAASALALNPVDAFSQATRPAGDPQGEAPNTRNFTRIFNLPPFAEATPEVKAALRDIGAPGGIMDAQDALERGPVDLILDETLRVNNPDNPDHTAGTTFVGQFLDHDMTFDTRSVLGSPTVPQQSPNDRTRSLDLDSVYGRGPVVDMHLYDPSAPAKLMIEQGGEFEDLPRTAGGRAIISDPRNDENVMLAGLHAAILMFHNAVVDMLGSRGTSTPAAFPSARRLVTWHYHWIIVHHFLPQIVGADLVRDVQANGRRFYRPRRGRQAMPVEFQGAAYRFGHSMVRPSYRANLAGDRGEPFFGFIFDPAEEGSEDPGDLRGGFRAPRRFVGWQTFFDFGDGEVRRNKIIDTRISTPMFHLPMGAIAGGGGPTALPQRNLLRHLTWGIPSGQRIAAAMGEEPLGADALPELAAYGLGLESSTPLWYYVLREASAFANGRTLGPVGGRIVAEVFLGLLSLDPGSYLSRKPSWRPTLPSRNPGDFDMVDLLTFAGVDPASRGQ